MKRDPNFLSQDETIPEVDIAMRTAIPQLRGKMIFLSCEIGICSAQ